MMSLLTKRSWEKSTQDFSQTEESEQLKKIKSDDKPIENEEESFMSNDYKFPGNINTD